jgi:hypothetical protein
MVDLWSKAKSNSFPFWVLHDWSDFQIVSKIFPKYRLRHGITNFVICCQFVSLALPWRGVSLYIRDTLICRVRRKLSMSNVSSTLLRPRASRNLALLEALGLQLFHGTRLDIIEKSSHSRLELFPNIWGSFQKRQIVFQALLKAAEFVSMC